MVHDVLTNAAQGAAPLMHHSALSTSGRISGQYTSGHPASQDGASMMSRVPSWCSTTSSPHSHWLLQVTGSCPASMADAESALAAAAALAAAPPEAAAARSPELGARYGAPGNAITRELDSCLTRSFPGVRLHHPCLAGLIQPMHAVDVRCRSAGRSRRGSPRLCPPGLEERHAAAWGLHTSSLCASRLKGGSGMILPPIQPPPSPTQTPRVVAHKSPTHRTMDPPG